MGCAEQPIPKCCGDSETSGRVSVVVLHMIFLEGVEDGEGEVRAEVEVVMQHIIENHEEVKA